MASNFSNVARGMYTRGSINDSDLQTVIQVSSSPAGIQEDGAVYGWPAPPFYVVIDEGTAYQEVCEVITKTGSDSTTLYTLVRGSGLNAKAFGSTSKAHNEWAYIKPIWSAADATDALNVADILYGGKTIFNAVASQSPLTIRMASGQTANAFDIKSYSDDTMFSVGPTGNVLIQKSTPGLTLDSTNGAASVYLRAPAGNDRAYRYYTGTSPRWVMKVTSESESGANAGSNFQILRYDDSGTYISSPITINRASGLVSIGTLAVSGATTFTSAITIGTPSAASHATTKTYVDTALALKFNTSGGALSGALTGTTATFSGQVAASSLALTGAITGATTGSFSGAVTVGTPTLATHAAQKSLVDAKVALTGDESIGGIKTFTGQIVVDDVNQIRVGPQHSQNDGVFTANRDVGGAIIYLSTNAVNTVPGRLRGWKANGSWASKTAVSNNDAILQIEASAWGGTGYRTAAYIRFSTDSTGTVSDSSMPGIMQFYTTSNGSTGATERMRIDSTGTQFTGPVSGLVSSSTNNGIARFDGTGGALQDSGVTIDDDGSLTADTALKVTKDGGNAWVQRTTTGTHDIYDTWTINGYQRFYVFATQSAWGLTTEADLVGSRITALSVDRVTGKVTVGATVVSTDAGETLATKAYVDMNHTKVQQVSNNYTPSSVSEAGTLYDFYNITSPKVFTIPNNTNVPFPIGTVLAVTKNASYALTFGYEAGVELRSPAGTSHELFGTWCIAYFTKRDVNRWIISGDLKSA